MERLRVEGSQSLSDGPMGQLRVSEEEQDLDWAAVSVQSDGDSSQAGFGVHTYDLAAALDHVNMRLANGNQAVLVGNWDQAGLGGSTIGIRL